jgi:hypothetical protein
MDEKIEKAQKLIDYEFSLTLKVNRLARSILNDSESRVMAAFAWGMMGDACAFELCNPKEIIICADILRDSVKELPELFENTEFCEKISRMMGQILEVADNSAENMNDFMFLSGVMFAAFNSLTVDEYTAILYGGVEG